MTIFNYFDLAGVWYPHVLSGVHLETDRGQILKKYGPDSKDTAELHIIYTEKDGQKVIMNAAGRELIWIPPKAWAKQADDDLPDSITFNPAMDFFWKGEWTGEDPISESAYTDRLNEGFFAYMNRMYDFVFKISSVSGPYAVVPHFEIAGR